MTIGLPVLAIVVELVALATSRAAQSGANRYASVLVRQRLGFAVPPAAKELKSQVSLAQTTTQGTVRISARRNRRSATISTMIQSP